MKLNSGKVTLSAVLAVSAMVIGLNSFNQPSTAIAGDKVYVCKYVGTPSVNESLQTGQNPIEVSVNAIPNGWSVGSYFADQHGRSFVLAIVPQDPEPNVNNCPQVVNSPSATPVATATPNDCDGECDPTATPVATATPAPTEEPKSPTCTGDQHLDASGRNCVSFSQPGPGESGKSNAQVGQVLGASTMAGTGMVEDAIFNSIFAFGSLLTSFGIMKNGKKRA